MGRANARKHIFRASPVVSHKIIEFIPPAMTVRFHQIFVCSIWEKRIHRLILLNPYLRRDGFYQVSVFVTFNQVRNAIEQLKSAPAYVEVLRLEQAPIPAKKGRRHQTPPPSEPVLSEQEIAGQSLIDTSVIPADNREGPDPGTFEELRELDIDANEIYGLANMEDLKRIMLYLK